MKRIFLHSVFTLWQHLTSASWYVISLWNIHALWLHFRLLMLNFNRCWRWKANNFGSYTKKSHCGSHLKHSKVLSFRKFTWYQCNVKLEMLPILLSSLALLHCINFTLICVKIVGSHCWHLKRSVLLQIDDLFEAWSGDQGVQSKREEFFCLLKAHVCLYQNWKGSRGIFLLIWHWSFPSPQNSFY